MTKDLEIYSPKQNEEILNQKWISSFELNKQKSHPILKWLENFIEGKDEKR